MIRFSSLTMGIKQNVFASKAEKKNFEKLARTWSDTYRIYHNLPFLNIFTLDDLFDYSDWARPVPLSLSEDEILALKKASVDYVLCDLDDSPLVCIEFDGLQNGFSVGMDYYPDRLPPRLRPWRRRITELKLRVAHGSLFPFFVVGSEQFKDITPHARLTIVDGIIGEVLSVLATRQRFSKGFDPEEVGFSQEQFDDLPSYVQHELIQDWAIGVEVHMELEYNPVSRKSAEEQYRLGVSSFTMEHFQYPSIPPDISVEDRIAAFENAIMFGTRVILHSQDHGDIEGEAWLPNFQAANFSPLGLVDGIAALIALDELRRKMGCSP